jgi:hypothetical protein
MAEVELRAFDEPVTRKSRGGLFFWWGVLLLLLMGACFASWLGSFYVISHPEVPKCYKLLKKLKRIEPPKRFAVTEAPKGDFLSPSKVLERFGKMGPAELERENADLLRAFIMNFRETKRHTVYITGKFDVVQAHQLGPLDFFPTGVTVIAQAIEFPQLVLEMLLTAPTKTVPSIKAAFPVGGDVTLHRSRDLFALLHVERLADGRMQFTTIPLPYGGWRIPKRELEFTLRSPEEMEKANPKFTLNIDAGLPVIKGERLTKGLDAYAGFRRKALVSATDDQKALASPELERFEVRVPTVAEAGTGTVVEPVPEAPPRSGQPGATNTRGHGHSVAPVITPRPMPTPAPAQPLPPRPIVKNPPRPTPAPIVPAPAPGIAPQVTVANPPATTPAPSATPGTSATPAPAPAPVPERRILTPSQTSALVDQFSGSQPTVLTGDFVVTGVLGQRVALRTRESLRDANADPTQPGTTAAFIVVDFPPGVPPPAKDSSFSRDGERGFLVRDVIRGRNGQITIVASEQGR